MTRKVTVAQALDVEVYVDIDIPDGLTEEEAQAFVDDTIWIGVFAQSNQGVARVMHVSNCGRPEIIKYSEES